VDHMLYLTFGVDPDHACESDLWVLCASDDREDEAARIVAEGRQDNLPDITCPECRALILKYM
jgi:hypothetical protein